MTLLLILILIINILGDSAYTAADVAKKLGMLKKDEKGKLDKPIRILEPSTDPSSSKDTKSLGLIWSSIDSDTNIPYDNDSFGSLASKSNLCITGITIILS